MVVHGLKTHLHTVKILPLKAACAHLLREVEVIYTQPKAYYYGVRLRRIRISAAATQCQRCLRNCFGLCCYGVANGTRLLVCDRKFSAKAVWKRQQSSTDSAIVIHINCEA
jgi:hypothetical protein